MSEGAASSPVTIDELLEHGRWVRRLATSLVVGEEAAEELTQASMVHAITRPPRHRGNLRAWLATLTRNLARDRGKAKSREKDPRWLEAAQREQPIESGDQIVARIETQRLVSEVLLGLDPVLRDVLVLRFYDEFSYREIGEQLGVPAETARSRITRGLAELRLRLDQRGGENAIEWRTGLVLWLGAGSWPRVAGSTGAAAGGGGLVGWAQGLTAFQIVTGLLLTGLLAALWWTVRLPGTSSALPPIVLDVDVQAPLGGVDVAVDRPELTTERDLVARDSSGSAAGAEEFIGCSGRVLRHDDSPVVGAEVRLTRGTEDGAVLAIETQTDVDGWFQFDGLMQGSNHDDARLVVRGEDQFALRISHHAGLASFEGRFVRWQLTSDDFGLTAVDADLGEFRLAPALDLHVELIGDWEASGSLWLAETSGAELPTHRLRQVAAWSKDFELTWWDAIGAYTQRDVDRVLIAYDGMGFGWAVVDLPLDPDAEHVFRLERLPPRRVELYINNPLGRPVAGIPVLATPLAWPFRAPGALDRCYHHDFMRPAGFDDARRATTDENGVAVFEALPAGLAAAFGANASPSDELGRYVFCIGDRSSTERPHHSLEHHLVQGPGVQRLELVYNTAASVDIAGVVLDEDRSPLAGIRVAAVDFLSSDSLTGQQGSGRESQAVTDSQGRFLLRDVDRDRQGIETLSVDGVEIGRSLLVFDVRVPEDGRLPLPIMLVPAFELRSWLVDPDGQPVHRPGLRVGLRPARLDPLRTLPSLDLSLEVAVDGSFEVQSLPRGEYLLYPLEFESSGLVPFDPILFQAGELQSEVVVGSLDAHATRVVLTVQDPLSGGIHGVVRATAIRERDGRRAPLVVEADSGLRTNRITWKALPPGVWRIDMRLHGGRRVLRSLELDGSQPDHADTVDLKSPGGLRASLESGAVTTALANAVVTARIVGPSWVDAGPDVESRFEAVAGRARVGSDGHFQFDDLPPGRYELRVGGNGLVGRHFVEIESGKLAEFTMPVGPARELVLSGDAIAHLDQQLQLRLSIKGTHGEWATWPIHWETCVARALLPEDALEWEARWWSPSVPGRQSSVALAGAVRGPVDGAGGAPIQAKLPR